MFYLLKTLLYIDVLIATGLLVFRWSLNPSLRRVVSLKIAALALLTPAVALFVGNFYLFCLYLLVIVACNARSRLELAATYLFLLPLVPPLSVETGVGGVYLLAVTAVGAMGIGALVGYVITGVRGTPTLARYDLAVCMLVGIFLFINNHNPTLTSMARVAVTQAAVVVGPYLLLSRAARTRADVEMLLLRLALGATVMAVTACFQARRHWVLFEAYFQTLHVTMQLGSASMALRAGMLRTGGSMIDYSSGGLFLAAMMTAILLLRRAFRPIGFGLVLLLLAAGLIATQSRGAWLAAIVGVVAVGAWRGRWGLVGLLAGGAAMGEAMILAFAKSGALANILGHTEEASGNVDYRQRLATRGWEQIQAHPLLGQSPDRLIAAMPDLTQGQHIVDFVNAHLFVAMAGGLPLFLAWCWVWLMPLIDSWRRRRLDPVLLAVPAALVVPPIVALTFTSVVDRNMTWPLIGLALTPACLAIARHGSAVARASAAGDDAAPTRHRRMASS